MEVITRGTNSAAATETERHEARIRALLKERDKCERRGLMDRVAEINAELGEVASEAKAPARRAEKRPSPYRRTSR